MRTELPCDPTRIDLLFTMSENTHDASIEDDASELMFRGRIDDGSIRRRSSTSSGGARRDRTDDLMLAKHALSQLSYGPVTRRRMLHVEVSTRSSVSPSSPLGLRRARFAFSLCVAAPRGAEGEAWWAWEDLNFRPHAYQ